MNMQNLKETYPNTVFGSQFAVSVQERVNTYGVPKEDLGKRINPLVKIWSEDDENWFEVYNFDIGHVPDLIATLRGACTGIELEWPRKHKLELK